MHSLIEAFAGPIHHQKLFHETLICDRALFYCHCPYRRPIYDLIYVNFPGQIFNRLADSIDLTYIVREKHLFGIYEEQKSSRASGEPALVFTVRA